MARHCISRKGVPKRAYATEAEALEAAEGFGFEKGAYHVYRCREHGYHLGGVLTRALRRILRHVQATKPKKKRKRKRPAC